MNMPGFTAEAGLQPSNAQYGGAVVASTGQPGQLRPALVAPNVCRTSGCLTVGRCRTRVRCCRNFSGSCSCRTVPCFFLGSPDQI